MKLTIERAKALCANPREFVPEGKLITSYAAINAQALYCIWDVPNIEALKPLLRNMSIVGWNTEVIPAEKTEVALEGIGKALQDVQAQRMAMAK